MREAVTAVLVHGDEIFFIRRQPHMRAFPGYLAFPGGKIDAADRDHHYSHPLLTRYPGAEMHALCRELQEELDFDLQQAVEQGGVDDISRLGTATTPVFEQIRFQVHYFKVTLQQRPGFALDREEIDWAAWGQPQALLQRYRQGEGPMVIPTVNVLRALSGDIDVQQVQPFGLEYDRQREQPVLQLINGVHHLPVPSQTLPPAHATNALLIGDCLVDSSPKDQQELEKLLYTLQRLPVERLLITHHHGDHHQFAPQIARQLDLPLLCTSITERRLRSVYGSDYLQGVSLQTISEGDPVCDWLGRSVHCYELPGHDDGMVGLAPSDMAWFFVSDLAQPNGSVVIPEPEGDMQAYLDSLQRVIDLQPKIIITSHGMPSGGTWLLQQTLAHRLQREVEIGQMHRDGRSPQQMLEAIYPQLNGRLVPLAQQNIRQHMRRLGLPVEQ